MAKSCVPVFWLFLVFLGHLEVSFGDKCSKEEIEWDHQKQLIQVLSEFNDGNVWLNDSAVFLTIYIFIMFQYVYVSFFILVQFWQITKKTVVVLLVTRTV